MPIKDFSTFLSKITKYNQVHLGIDPSVARLLGHDPTPKTNLSGKKLWLILLNKILHSTLFDKDVQFMGSPMCCVDKCKFLGFSFSCDILNRYIQSSINTFNRKCNVFLKRCSKTLHDGKTGVSIKDRRTSEELRKLVGVEPITTVIRSGRL